MKSSVKNDDLIRHQESFFPRDVPGGAGSLHPRQHDILSAADHTVTGSEWDIVGLTAVDTLGLLTPLDNTSAGIEAILKSDANGRLLLDSLGIGTAAAASDRIEMADGASIGETGFGAITFVNAPSAIYVTGADVTIYNTTGVAEALTVRSDTTQLRLDYESDNSKYATFTVGSTGTIELDAISNIVLDPGGQNVNPGSTITDDLGAYNVKWRTLYAAELYVETLVAQYVMATIGGRIMVAPTTKLTLDHDPINATIWVEHNIFAVDDYILLETAPGGIAQIEVMQITSGPTGAGPYSYGVLNKNLDGSGSNSWVKGDAVVNLGYAVGEGYIDITSTQTIHSQLGPTITIFTRSDTANWNDVKPTVTMGNLDSFLGYGTKYGFAVGNDLSLAAPSSSSFIGATMAQDEGLRLYNTDLKLYDGATPKVQIDHGEGIRVSGGAWGTDYTVFAAVFATDATIPSLQLGDVIIGKPFHSVAAQQVGLHWDYSNASLKIMSSSTDYLYISGSNVSFYSAGSRTIYLEGSTGDATFGVVAANTGNMMWDASDAILRFRGGAGGTVTQAYIATDGTISAGASEELKLSQYGMRIAVQTVSPVFSKTVSENIKWIYTASDTLIGSIASWYIGSPLQYGMYLKVENSGSGNDVLRLDAANISIYGLMGGNNNWETSGTINTSGTSSIYAGGDLMAGSGLVVGNTGQNPPQGVIMLLELAGAPDTPPSGYGYLYALDDGELYYKNDAGVAAQLS